MAPLVEEYKERVQEASTRRGTKAVRRPSLLEWIKERVHATSTSEQMTNDQFELSMGCDRTV